MRLKHDFIEDNLLRKDLAKKYVKFLNDLKGNHTIALDAPWGSGKSKFIDFMCEEFDSENGKTKDVFIVYNAWENDYTDDPFLSLMSDFFSQIKNKQYVGEDELKGLMDKSFLACKIIGKGVLLGGIKKLFDSDEVASTLTELNEIVTNTSKELTSEFFTNIDKNKKTRKDFTQELEKTVKKILEEKGKNKFIIIIDELDRCKPTFAIELLENIKHLFEIKEIVFFIAIDKTQLAESIKSVYGSGFDAETYLHRFFDFEVHLPKKNILEHFKIIIDNKLGEDAYNYYCKDYINDAIKLFDITIRDFERIISETLLLKNLNNISYPKICILLLIFKNKYKKVYDIFVMNKTLYYENIQSRIEKFDNSEELNSFLIVKKKILAIEESHSRSGVKLKEETIELLELIENTL